MGPAALAAILLGASAAVASAQAPSAPTPVAARIRVVLDASAWPTRKTLGESRTLTEYAEQTTIRSSYEAGTALGPDASVQLDLFRGFGLLVGYSYASRDVTGQVDVSRPHPLYLDRPRQASAGISGYSLAEGALHVDIAYARAAGPLDWALFAGATLFQVEADLLLAPAYDEQYPYDDLAITATPSTTVREDATGFNVGGRLDYRFGTARRFGAGLQVRYSRASVRLEASPGAGGAELDAGGISVGAGIRLYF